MFVLVNHYFIVGQRLAVVAGAATWTAVGNRRGGGAVYVETCGRDAEWRPRKGLETTSKYLCAQ